MMPRPFTHVEKTTIREQLLEAGRDCFLRFGLKKTTIDDLVRPAGIAKGSFYRFFESKEALYVETLMNEMPAMTRRLVDASFRATDDTREALVLLMKQIVRELETNPLSRVLLNERSELDRVATSVDLRKILQQATPVLDTLYDEVRRAQERGEMVSGDPQRLFYAIGMIKLYPLNRDRLPQALYDEMLHQATQVIADGLTCPARTDKEAA